MKAEMQERADEADMEQTDGEEHGSSTNTDVEPAEVDTVSGKDSWPGP